MFIKFRGHKYRTLVKIGFISRLPKQLSGYNYPVSSWFMHDTDCCDYWVSSTNTTLGDLNG